MHNPPKLQPQTGGEKGKSGQKRPAVSLFQAKPLIKHLKKTIISQPRFFNRCFKSFLKYSSNLSISPAGGIAHDQLLKLSRQRGAFKRLPKFLLDSFMPRNISLRCFSRLLKNLKNLQTLKSQASLSTQDRRYKLKDLFRGIKSLKALTSLHLDLEYSEIITRIDFKRLIACLKKLPKLHCLRLSIQSYHHDNNADPNNFDLIQIPFPIDQDPADVIAAILNHQNPPPAAHNNQNPPAAGNNQNLPPPIQDYTYLKTAIKRLKNLRALEFSFTFLNEVSDFGIEQLLTQIQELDLVSLQMRFVRCPRVGSQSAATIGDTLKKLKSLASFALAMDVQAITRDDMLQLCAGLSFRKSTLLYLDLDFSECDVIDDYMMGWFSLAIKALYNPEAKTDSTKPEYLTKLEFLRLNLASCKFTDKGVEDLINMLKTLLSLNALHLNCNYCRNITTNSVKSLCGHLNHIQKCNLYFEDCPNINSEEVKKELYQNLKSQNVLFFDGTIDYRTTGTS